MQCQLPKWEGSVSFNEHLGVALTELAGNPKETVSRLITCSITLSRSLAGWLLSIRAARIPHSVRESIWSFINEISGETTIAIPGRVTAGA